MTDRAGHRCYLLVRELLAEVDEHGRHRWNVATLAAHVKLNRNTITNIRDQVPGKSGSKRAIDAFTRALRIHHDYFFGGVEPTTYRAFQGRADGGDVAPTVPLSFVEFLEMYQPRDYSPRIRELMLGQFREGSPTQASDWAKIYQAALRSAGATVNAADAAAADEADLADLPELPPASRRR